MTRSFPLFLYLVEPKEEDRFIADKMPKMENLTKVSDKVWQNDEVIVTKFTLKSLKGV